MTANEREKIDKFINDYRLSKHKIKILNIKRNYILVRDPKGNTVSIDNKIDELKLIDDTVKANVNDKYIQVLDIFSVKLDKAMIMLGLSKSSITKVKSKIRKEFIKVMEIVEAD